MILIPLVLFLAFIYLKMRLSKSTYFQQDREKLADDRFLLTLVLKNKGFTQSEINQFLSAFNAFKNFPSVFKFDGATIVGDSYTINGLSATAMLHDYDCIIADNSNFVNYLNDRLLADKKYRRNLIKSKRKLVINTIFAYILWFGLVITIPIYYLITKKR